MVKLRPITTLFSDEIEDELYEKKRVRKIRRRALIVIAAILVFFGITAIPIVERELPKWAGRHVARVLTDELESIVILAQKSEVAYHVRLSLDPIQGWIMTIQTSKTCDLESETNPMLSSEIKPISSEKFAEKFDLVLMTGAEAEARFQIHHLTDSFCFDPLQGFRDQPYQTLAILPANDLTNNVLDRASYVIVDAKSAKITFR